MTTPRPVRITASFADGDHDVEAHVTWPDRDLGPEICVAWIDGKSVPVADLPEAAVKAIMELAEDDDDGPEPDEGDAHGQPYEEDK